MKELNLVLLKGKEEIKVQGENDRVLGEEERKKQNKIKEKKKHYSTKYLTLKEFLRKPEDIK